MSSIRTFSNGGTNTNAKMKRQEKAAKIGIILNELRLKDKQATYQLRSQQR